MCFPLQVTHHYTYTHAQKYFSLTLRVVQGPPPRPRWFPIKVWLEMDREFSPCASRLAFLSPRCTSLDAHLGGPSDGSSGDCGALSWNCRVSKLCARARLGELLYWMFFFPFLLLLLLLLVSFFVFFSLVDSFVVMTGSDWVVRAVAARLCEWG
jgi:hypothetical protein